MQTKPLDPLAGGFFTFVVSVPQHKPPTSHRMLSFHLLKYTEVPHLYATPKIVELDESDVENS
uniref:Uncharacterized protein n=1 Tax=Heterorhabditis bacteriophora TaxID=37862 RepID=A0A1I7XJY2_HETBA